jgi:ribosomal protein S18 acetylase RimI-like enzyme
MHTMTRTMIRLATRTDVERIRTVIARANEEFRRDVPRVLFDAYLSTALDVEGRFLGGQVLVAEIDRRVVGTITFYADANDEGIQATFPPLTAGIRATAVDPSAQGQGIGRALVEACIERATTQGAAAITLHTASFMTAAIALYERLGFRRSPTSDVAWSHYFPIEGDVDATAIGYVRPIP